MHSSSRVHAFVALAGFAVCASVQSTALAQLDPYPVDSQLKYQVWNGSEWASSVVARPGDRVEMRVVVSYTGSAPVRGLGQILYQPTFSNWDNEGPSIDNIGAWRNGGVSGNSNLATGLLSNAEGQSGDALPSYGRIGFAAIGTTTQSLNVLTSFRHSGGSMGAPQGSWLRIAGSFCSTWPRSGQDPLTVADGNNIGRGVAATQWGELTGTTQSPNRNPYWIPGTTDLVIFRQAVLLSDQSTSRVIEVSSDQSSLDRSMVLGGTDNRRSSTWWTTPVVGAIADLRVGVEIVPAQIIISPYIPAPSAAALLGLSGLFAVRRRR